MKRCFAPLAMVLAVLILLPTFAAAQVNFKAIAASKHFTRHAPRPTDLSDFASLDEWIKANYNTTLLAETIEHSFQDGREVISFFTTSENGLTDHHKLVDTGEGFTVETTSAIEPPGDAVESLAASLTLPQAETSKFSPMAAVASTSSCSQYACNCVNYARCTVPKYPTPAYWYTEKLKTINTYTPSVGAVAIMNYDQPYGHVGVINGQWWVWQGWVANMYLSLNEANFVSCKVTTSRSGTIPQLHIVGYYRP